MKSKFPAYYRIHRNDLIDHFDDCIFMFDTCALLDIYRMKKEVTDDVFKVMEHLKEQIRIPYHVAEEYFKNIHVVLNDQIKKIERSRTEFKTFIQNLEAKRSQPYISKKTTNLLEKLKRQVENDFNQQEEYIKYQLVYGEYQNRMNDLLEGKVLEPFTEEELVEIKKDGDYRLENSIPPGYKDAQKTSNRYGDLINWKEILRFAKESGKCIVIVSSEQKEDWVLREYGRIICLRYELLTEFYETVGNNKQLIHFLSLDRFLELAREIDEKVVSESTVTEVKNYVTQPVIKDNSILYDALKMRNLDIPDYSHLMPSALAGQIETLHKIQEQLDPKIYSEIMAKMPMTRKPFDELFQKAAKNIIPSVQSEEKATWKIGTEEIKNGEEDNDSLNDDNNNEDSSDKD